jgi:hypothetical protein
LPDVDPTTGNGPVSATCLDWSAVVGVCRDNLHAIAQAW